MAAIVIGSLLGALALAICVVCILAAAWRDPTCYDTELSVAPYQQVVDSRAHRSKFPAVSEDGRLLAISRGPYSYWRSKPPREAHVRAVGAGTAEVVRAPSRTTGSVDARMFRFRGVDYLLMFVDPRQHLVALAADTGAPGPSVPLDYEGSDRIEKNWCPYVRDGALHFITRLRPMRVVRCADPATGACVVVHDAEPGWAWDDAYASVRGSSPLVPTAHPDLYVGLAHTAGGANAAHRWNKLETYRALVFAYDARACRIAALSGPLDLTPLYPCLGLRARDYVRVHFATQLHPPSAPVARGLDGDWLASVDLFDTRGLFVRLRGLDAWLRRVAARAEPEDLALHTARTRQRWSRKRLGGLNIVANWFNLLKSAVFRRSCGAEVVI